MKENFAYSLKTTLVYEGGYSNNPKDPGGSTMKGVTQATYNAYRKSLGLGQASVKFITQAELEALYRRDFWNKVHGDDLASGVDLVVWDYGVNSGPSRAWTALLKSVGGSDLATVKKVCASRLTFLRGLKTFSTFGKGWTARVHSVEAKGIALVAGPNARTTLMSEELESHTKASSVVRTAATGSVAGTATVVAGGAAISTTSLVVLAAVSLVVLAAVGIIVYAKYKEHKSRAEAMATEALNHGH